MPNQWLRLKILVCWFWENFRKFPIRIFFEIWLFVDYFWGPRKYVGWCFKESLPPGALAPFCLIYTYFPPITCHKKYVNMTGSFSWFKKCAVCFPQHMYLLRKIKTSQNMLSLGCEPVFTPFQAKGTLFTVPCKTVRSLNIIDSTEYSTLPTSFEYISNLNKSVIWTLGRKYYIDHGTPMDFRRKTRN